MDTEDVVFQKPSAINAIIFGNLVAGCFIISEHQLIGQVWYSCIHNFSVFRICPCHYRLVCTTSFTEYESHVEGAQVTVCRRDKLDCHGVRLGR